MPMPFYVSPDQLMQDKADFARKGIARGKSVVACEYDGGYVIMAENLSTVLNKVSEIYDRIAFAGVGKYSEFEHLRKEGIRFADVKGYSYSREDVLAKSLANAFSTVIGHVFTAELKPLEVEVLVLEVGDAREQDSIYHISYDGAINDFDRHVAIGGQADRIRTYLKENYKDGLSLEGAFRLCKKALEVPYNEKQTLTPEQIEVAVLQRGGDGRRFRRLEKEETKRLAG